jgi:hypothetical protein
MRRIGDSSIRMASAPVVRLPKFRQARMGDCAISILWHHAPDRAIKAPRFALRPGAPRGALLPPIGFQVSVHASEHPIMGDEGGKRYRFFVSSCASRRGIVKQLHFTMRISRRRH